MQAKEDGLPSGSLVEYVSWKVEEAKRQAAEAQNRQPESSIQQTTLLARFGELATPIQELFSRFQVRELLEEARSRYFRFTPPLAELMPTFYRVPDPYNPHRLEGYGLQLPRITYIGTLITADEIAIYREYYVGSGPFYFMGPERVSGYTGGGSREIRRRTTREVFAGITQFMSVRAIKPEETDAPLVAYDLEYTLGRNIKETRGAHIKRYDGLGNPLADRPLINEEVVDKKIRIKANQPPEVLKKIIGDEIAAILTSRTKR